MTKEDQILKKLDEQGNKLDRIEQDVLSIKDSMEVLDDRVGNIEKEAVTKSEFKSAMLKLATKLEINSGIKELVGEHKKKITNHEVRIAALEVVA